MMSNHDDTRYDTSDEFQRARAQLERAAAGLDEFTVARLRAARLRAIDATPTPRASWWLPLSAATAATFVAIALTLTTLSWRGASEPGATVIAASDDLELLMIKESPDLLDEQLEFYHWLGDQSDAG